MYLSGSFHKLVIWKRYFSKSWGPPVLPHTMPSPCVPTGQRFPFWRWTRATAPAAEMTELMAYAASVGSARAKRKVEAVGFVGNATDATAHYFGQSRGFGTMPHAMIGYAGSTLRAAEMYDECFPDEPMTVLVDYFAEEVTDTLAVCRRFKERADAGTLSIRIDIAGSRYLEGLDPSASYAVLERHVPEAVRGYRTEEELRYLVGPGVSAAAIWRMREVLNDGGFPKVKIVASSGFGPKKCHDGRS